MTDHAGESSTSGLQGSSAGPSALAAERIARSHSGGHAGHHGQAQTSSTVSSPISTTPISAKIGGPRLRKSDNSNSSNSSENNSIANPEGVPLTSAQQPQQQQQQQPTGSCGASGGQNSSRGSENDDLEEAEAGNEADLEDEDEKEEGFSSATSSPVKLPFQRRPQTGNHIRYQDIDIELGEVCTAINKFAMSANSDSKEALTEGKEKSGKSSEMTNIPMGPVGGGSIDVNPCSIEADESNGPANDDEQDVAYITQLDKDGNIQQVPISFDDKVDEPNPLADFMSTDILAKPFNFVSGNTKRSRFNPFRKKSGLLNVLARQATKNRILFKNGYLNVYTASDEVEAHKFLQDIFVSIIDLNWGWIYVIFAAAFFFSWLGFAIVWYLTFLVHGDFDEENRNNETFVPCASAIIDFTSCFLFSLETQHTIGYGGRATTEQCPFAIIVMSTQSILGVIIQACMAGVIFAKFTVPKKRGQTIVFSKNAVITMRNGALYLICRVSDLRKSSLLEAHVRMVIIRKEVTEEGETVPFQMSDLEVTTEMEEENDRLLILWPVTVAHKIDEDSPLYEMGPRDILNAQFELIVTMEGVTEETGNTIQVRTSYLPNEILWGHIFDHNVLVYDKKLGMYQIMHSRINKTAMDDTPRISAYQLLQRSKRNSSGLSNSTSSDQSPNKKISYVRTTSATNNT